MPWAELNGQSIDNEFHFDAPVAPFNEVKARFEDTMLKAEEMLELLVGPNGTSGYLGDLSAIITNAPVTSVTAPAVDTSYTLATSGQSVPVFDKNDLKAYPALPTYPDPTVLPLPAVTTNFPALSEPTDVSPTLSYSETLASTAVYTPLLARMLDYLQAGYTGIDPVAEQALYDRAKTRQQAERVAEWNRINDLNAAMQFALPSGVLTSALTDFSIGATRQDAEINNQIIITKSELEQKNNQFIMQQAIVLEQLIRQTASEQSARALDAAKAQVSAVLQDFSERVKRYMSVWEGRKTEVMAQVEALRGVIEANKGAVETFKAQYDAMKTRAEAITAQNDGIVKAFVGQVQGFGEAERAVLSRNESAVKLIEAKVAAAELEVRAAVANAQSLISGYQAEGSLREKVTSDMAHIAAQVVASMMSAVHASESWGYNASESSSTSFSMGTSLNESHSYEHDPTT